jgi:hypothetical protein
MQFLEYLESENEPRSLIQEFCKSARELISAQFAVVGLASVAAKLPIRWRSPVWIERVTQTSKSLKKRTGQ